MGAGTLKLSSCLFVLGCLDLGSFETDYIVSCFYSFVKSV